MIAKIQSLLISAVCVFILALPATQPSLAEIITNGAQNTQMFRAIYGEDTGSQSNPLPSTVVYEAGIPADLGGLPGIVGEPNTISDNPIPDGKPPHTVFIHFATNVRSGTPNPLTGTYTYDSSTKMICTTPASCGNTEIPFTKIRWEARDSDTLNNVLSYDGSASQFFHTQTDPNGDHTTALIHQNWYRFIYDNDVLLPAGEYVGSVFIHGEGS